MQLVKLVLVEQVMDQQVERVVLMELVLVLVQVQVLELELALPPELVLDQMVQLVVQLVGQMEQLVLFKQDHF